MIEIRDWSLFVERGGGAGANRGWLTKFYPWPRRGTKIVSC